MIIHSDSTLGALFSFLVAFASLSCLIAAIAGLFVGQFRTAVKAFGIGMIIIGAFVIGITIVSLVTPQTVVNVGDSYCEDIWCIGIDKVETAPSGRDVVYSLDAHIFSDANHVKTSAKGAHLYLFDENNRHFPLVQDATVTPFDISLDPGQKVATSFRCIAPADSQHLYLWYSRDDPSRPAPFWVKWYFGSEHNIFRKPTLIRVL
jgi:hypothetical protein